MSAPSSEKFNTQVAIVGGGVAGLWIQHALTSAGIRSVLFEKNGLGGGQTLASQGMIHGGIKYALDGFETASSETIATMPARWEACLAGTGEVDLRDVDVLSRDYYLFSDNSLASRVTAFLGSKSLRGRIEPVPSDDYPPFLKHTDFRGNVYRLKDIVVDTSRLVASLAAKSEGRLFEGTPETVVENGRVEAMKISETITVTADKYVFCAGAGNEALIAGTALESVGQQRRPLKQVLVKKSGLPATYAHAASLSAGAKPRVTVTTHEAADGSTVWYLGGNLAETGIDRSDEEQVGFAKRELADILPWISFGGAAWQTLSVDRAEPRSKDLVRPDAPFCKHADNAVVCWPTKLTLTPLLCDEVMSVILADKPRTNETTLPQLPPATMGRPPWDTLF